MSQTYFLALFPEKQVIDEILSIQRQFSNQKRNFNFVSPEHLHLHIQMLGADLSPDSLETIKHYFPGKAANIKAPQLSLDRLKFGKPSQKIATTLSLEQKNDSHLKVFTRDTHFFIQGLEIDDIISKKDQARMIENVNIAFTKKNMYKTFTTEIRKQIREVNFKPIRWQPKSIYLVQKEFSYNESRLTKLEEFKLA